MWDKVQETVKFLNKKGIGTAQYAIILGSGLGNFIDKIEVFKTIDYKEIPHFPVSTVQGHKGRLVYGTIGHKKVLAFQGRFHFYEGYTMKELTFPIRVLFGLAIKNLIVSNASGGVNPSFKVIRIFF